MSDPLEDLRAHALYDTAMEEIVSIMPPVLKDSQLLPIHAVRELCIAVWIRGASWQRDDANRASGGG